MANLVRERKKTARIKTDFSCKRCKADGYNLGVICSKCGGLGFLKMTGNEFKLVINRHIKQVQKEQNKSSYDARVVIAASLNSPTRQGTIFTWMRQSLISAEVMIRLHNLGLIKIR